MNKNNKLFTIGYGGRTPQQLLDVLKKHAVESLADVRYAARTQIPGFNKSQLEPWARTSHLRYVHLEDLGNLNYKNKGDLPIKLADEEKGLTSLKFMVEYAPTCIMCACRNYVGCHREVIAQKLQARFPDLQVAHIP